jgi:predicted DNA-binding protein
MGSKTNKTKAISIAVEPETAEKLTYIGKQDHRTLSAYVRLVLINTVENYEKKNGKIKLSSDELTKPRLITRTK